MLHKCFHRQVYPTLNCGRHGTEPQLANTCINTQQHEGVGYPGDREGTFYGRAGYPHEIPLQGHGAARMGRFERECAAGMAREGVYGPIVLYCFELTRFS